MFKEWDKEIISQSIKQLTEKGIDPNKILETVPNILPGAIESLASEEIDHWKQTGRNIAEDNNKHGIGFKERLYKFWEIPLSNLESFVWFCHELGNEYNQEFRPRAHQENNLVYEVISRQHARSCCIGLEIIELIKTGFANGAMSRWRSLHENAVLTSFIIEHGLRAAELYISHDVIQVSKALDVTKHMLKN